MSGKKEILVDSKQIYFQKLDEDNFKVSFKLGVVPIQILQFKDGSVECRIADRNFNDFVKDEKCGRLKKLKEEYNKQKVKEEWEKRLKAENEKNMEEERIKKEEEKKKKKKRKNIMMIMIIMGRIIIKRKMNFLILQIKQKKKCKCHITKEQNII